MERADGFVQEPRFPHPRLADDADDLPVTLLGPRAGLTEDCELGRPTDEARPSDGGRLWAQQHPRIAPGVAQTFQHEASRHKGDDRLGDDDRPRAVDRHEVFEDAPCRGFAVHRDGDGGALSSHDVVIAIDTDHGVNASARCRAGAHRRGVDRQGRQGGVAGRVVDWLEAKDRHEAGRARVFDAPAKALDLLGDHLQCARHVDGGRREDPGAEEGEVATFPLGRDGPVGGGQDPRRRAQPRRAQPCLRMSQAVLVHARAERIARDAEGDGGSTNVAVVGTEGGFDVAAETIVQ